MTLCLGEISRMSIKVLFFLKAEGRAEILAVYLKHHSSIVH